MEGTQEMHGIQIKQITDQSNLVGNSPNKRKRMQSANIEETKINFLVAYLKSYRLKLIKRYQLRLFSLIKNPD